MPALRGQPGCDDCEEAAGSRSDEQHTFWTKVDCELTGGQLRYEVAPEEAAQDDALGLTVPIEGLGGGWGVKIERENLTNLFDKFIACSPVRLNRNQNHRRRS